MSLGRLRILRSPWVAAGVLALTVASVALTPASADTPHPAVVSDNPANYTPALVHVDGEAKPIADTIAVSGNTVAAGGRFTTLTQDGTTYARRNLVLFDADDGDVRPALDANNRVWAAVASGGWIYVGGQFTSLGGVPTRSIARINAATGLVDPGFRSAVRGRVNVLAVANGRLYAGGSFGAKVAALNLETGANTGTFDLAITDQLPNSWGNGDDPRHGRQPAGDQAGRDRQLRARGRAGP